MPESHIRLDREFQELRTQWISPLYDLFRKAFYSIPDPDDPELSTNKATFLGDNNSRIRASISVTAITIVDLLLS